MLNIKPSVPELNYLWNLQNPGFKLRDSVFSCILLKNEEKQKEKIPTQPYTYPDTHAKPCSL
jgi:hypothetical protein